MNSKISKYLSTIIFSSTILLFSSMASASHDWNWVDDELANNNYGVAANWEIDNVTTEAGEEYIVEDAVCRDYEITVEKYRAANPQGRGKYQEVTAIETETFCQPALATI